MSMLTNNVKVTTFRGLNIDVENPSTNLFNRFEIRALEHPNKVAVVLDDQSITYGELYSLVTSLASRLAPVVHPGDVVCQCVERSIEMVVGILAIFMCNTVYSPISSKNPIERRRTLLNETRAKVILVHQATDHLFSGDERVDCIKLRIDETENTESALDNVITHGPASLAYIVFTSGSTGVPKGVPITHTNFAYYLASMCHENYMHPNDITLQTSRDTFDVHLQEILGSILIGGTCVLLRPNSGAHLNIAYLIQTICQHQITSINVVPSLVTALIDYLSRLKQRFSPILRLVISTGEPFPWTLASELLEYLSPNAQFLNSYGVTEATVDCTYRRVFQHDMALSSTSTFVPIGVPIPNYVFHIIEDEEGEENGVGELLIGGPAVFQGYLNRGPDPRDSRLLKIDEDLCYRTGDLVKVVNGELAYVGRRDFQVKIRGQRIETGEIETVIMRESHKQLSACLVTAHDNQLIAYVQTRSSDIDAEQIVNEACHRYLPTYMIPSCIVTLDQFPLNPNGKIDRARLPPPPAPKASLATGGEPQNELEVHLNELWCRLLEIGRVPRDVNLYTLGANSLHFMLAANDYHTQLHTENTQLDLSTFLRHATIAEHAEILLAEQNQTITTAVQPFRHLTEGPSSFEQEAIWLDEQIRFRSDKDSVAVYHIVLIFRILRKVDESQLDILRLRSSLQLLVEKHASLRTCLQISDDNQGELHQRTLPSNLIEVPFIESWIDNDDDDLSNIITDEETNRSHFDLIQGRVFRAHLIRYRERPGETIILFNFHHSIFDGTSEALFLKDLHQAYATGKLIDATKKEWSYLDYARWERQLDMLVALTFWKDNLKDHQIFELPYDRICPTTVRTGRGSSVLVETFHGYALVAYARQQQVTLFQLCLAMYYSFLYKLTGNRDMIVGSLVANRTRPEIGSIVGMFANLVPYRLKIEPQETFRQLIERVQILCHNVFPHIRLPFQTVSKLLHPASGITAAIAVEIITAEYPLDDNNNLQLSTIIMPVNMTPFDLSLKFKHNLSTNMITCTFEYSLDVFDCSTIEILARRFQLLFPQLLADDRQSIYKFSILLDHERQLLHDFNPPRPIPEFEPCHRLLARRTDDHPQKIGMVMEEQCLSYSEILYYVQQWATHILATYRVNIGDILLQVVERSIEIVLGVFAIWMCGGVYAPFNPRDSLSQLHSRIEKLGARVLLVHQSTRSFATIDSTITVIDLDRIPLEQHRDVSILDTIAVGSDYLSHILFTSGSTGEPKAIQLNHRNFISYTRAAVIDSTSIVLHHRSVAFDPHLEEIAGSLISGAQVVLLKPDPCHLDMDYFSATIGRNQVSFIGIVPTALITMTNLIQSMSQVEQDTRLKSLRCIVSGGEKLYVTTVLNLRPLLNSDCIILNFYGPAECAVAATCYHVTGEEAQNHIGLPIGRPLAHTQIYILDEFLQEVIPGQIGEIIIGGNGVFIGYRNQDELTRQVMIDYKGSRCYRTGDFGRLNVQIGQLEFLGRRDHQVKIRGQRIELDGIEQVILRFDPKILNCLVVKGSIVSEEHLIAYVQCSDNQYSVNESELRSFCQQHLTAFMVPSFFIILDQFPLSYSGKIDRARLPQPAVSNVSKDQNQVLSPLEQKLCSIFALAFDLPDPSLLNVTTTFAELGATSLGIIKALSLIRRQQLNGSHPIDIGTLLANPSVRLLAQALHSSFSHDDILTNTTSSVDDHSNDRTLSRSLLIETLGIFFLVYIFAVPIYLALRFSLILAPVLHLLNYLVFQRLLPLPSSNESSPIFSLVYYRWWFLQRLWKLNDPWHRLLHGTSLYNIYLRLCGARIGVNVHLRTSLIDQPDLLDIGDNSFVAEDVVLSSMTYESETFKLTPVYIGKKCSIGARSVLHSEVHIGDGVSIKPLTAISKHIVDLLAAGSIINDPEQERVSEANVTSLFYSVLGICVVWFIHECLLRAALILSQSYWSFTCLLWLLECISISFISLKWLPSGTESWWRRQLLVTAFGFAIPFTFDGDSTTATEYIYPGFVRWLGRISMGRNVRCGSVTNLLMIRRNLLNVGSNVTLGSDILFNDGNAVTYIEDGASFGNDCLIEAGARIPLLANVGSMTRVDSSPVFTQPNQVLFGIPAFPTTTLFVTTHSADESLHSQETSHSIIRSICIRFVSLLLIFSILHVAILPISLILFSLMVCTLSTSRKDSSFASALARTLMNDFLWCLGPFFGGTQWLNILLNVCGATIHRTAIIADIDCIDDPHMMQIGADVRIDQRARIQAHTYEYRQLYMRPVFIGTRSHLMSNAFILPGCHLDGNNTIYPCTLVMKGDQLPANTHWKGSPARHCSSASNIENFILK